MCRPPACVSLREAMAPDRQSASREHLRPTDPVEYLGHGGRAEATVEQLKLSWFDERGMSHTARMTEREKLFAQTDDVVGQSRGFQCRVEPSNQPAILR